MKLEIRRYQPQDAPALERLNSRLQAGGSHHRVYPEPEPQTDRDRSHKVFVAATPPEIRGGTGLVEQTFRIAGRSVRAGWVKYPVAESLVDRAHSGVPGSLIFQLMREQPLLMALGLGGHSGPLARLLAGMRWQGTTVPFYFAPVRPAVVMRRLDYLRRTPMRRLLLDAAAASGIGWAATRLASIVRAPGAARALRGIDLETVPRFGPWADAAWELSRDRYGFAAWRDSASLNAAYPGSFEGLTRLRLKRDGEDIGWAAVLRMDLTEREDSRYFGRLVVGVVADGFAAPEDAGATVAAAVHELKSQGVDLIISNQSHPSWTAALRGQGFFEGPSNFAFYRSPAMQKLLEQDAVEERGIFLNRGDCDGPKWL